MKQFILLLAVLLFSPSVLAECFPDLLPLELPHRWCALCWVAPTERTDNTPLPLSEITGYQVEELRNGAWEGVVVNNTETGVYWYSNGVCPLCDEVRIKTLDIITSGSVWVNACQPETPLICI